ncbi:hypothetical protein ACUOA5_38550, partial [Escherichia coli]
VLISALLVLVLGVWPQPLISAYRRMLRQGNHALTVIVG